ncbi:biotin-dependent carboxyltransferase family protein [Lutibacter holmesii]|uniref:Biotin-dependent carboxyltransferase family protein n=1 Tax=Lutibacter holmesii TaxID=1137985 RepID=A0ABW3WNU1_9FLAO
MIKVLRPGLQSSIQDLGRFHYRKYGVPMSGTMDAISAGLANGLLNNDENAAVIEITLSGPKLEFTVSTTAVITGAEMSPVLNNLPISNYKVFKVEPGDILSFGKLIKGARCYLAVKGGFQSPKVLGSRSFYKGITQQERFVKQDIIAFNTNKNNNLLNKGVVNNKQQFYETENIKVTKGPELELFTLKEQQDILSRIHTISNKSNRMGYRLNEQLVPHDFTIITSPVLPGTIQIVPSGHLIILMKDGQTTGGYPRIFQLTEKSIAILAQKKSGDQFKFILE